MNLLSQILSVTALNFRNLRSRFWPSLVIVVGMACVVGVMVSMLSLSLGYVAAMMKTGDAGRAIIISDGQENELASTLTRDQVAMIGDAPGIAKDADGAPLADGEIIAANPTHQKANGAMVYMYLRGFGPKGFTLRPELTIVAGRMVNPGAQEVIVGRAALGQFDGMALGDKIIMPNGEWPIVGVFSTGGDMLEGQLIADRDTLMAAVRRTNFNAVIARLDQTPDALATFKKALTGNPALSVIAERHDIYYEHATAPTRILFSAVAYAVGGIMAVGALFGALNIMYAAVAARRREIATLRAIGFGAFPVALSVVAESLFLALAGAVIGAGLSWALFDGSQKAYFNNVFDLQVTPALLGLGILWAVVVALLGALLPSIRAARLPVVDALRAT